MDRWETLTMSVRELDRLEILKRVQERRLTQAVAAKRLDLSLRQVERLCRALRTAGPPGLVSRRRGRSSNRQLATSLQAQVVALVREHYADFGPTLALEKLVAHHDVAISVETLRTWMRAAGLWVPRALRPRRAHQPRQRRACRGELVQIDGSDHTWFEDRGPRCTLLVYIDDATSELMALRFGPSESAFEYFAATQGYLEEHGKPVAFYSDKASIFRVADTRATRGVTQFGRALTDLNIDIICANTPQAKGRVERANQTLQDRLVKELRLQGIATPEAGNAFLPTFRVDFNRRFARAPSNPHDAHRPLRADEDLAPIFTWQEARKLSTNLTVHYQCITYLVTPNPAMLALRGHQVQVHEDAEGQVTVRHQGALLPIQPFVDKKPMVRQADIVANKRLDHILTLVQAQQRERDAARLANPHLTLRQKARLRAARTAADAPSGLTH
jgi:transposase